MYKIRKIKFQEHPILKNLELDFCGKDGKAFDTIIFAGENGTGKSTIINALYEIASHTVKYPVLVEFEYKGKIDPSYIVVGKNKVDALSEERMLQSNIYFFDIEKSSIVVYSIICSNKRIHR